MAVLGVQAQAQAQAQDGPRTSTASAPDVDATLVFESRALGADGVWRSTRYSERFVRRAGHVWTARILPSGAGAATKVAAHGHRHFDYELAARHVYREAGEMRVEFADARTRMLVSVPPAEYENVGFDGSWERAASLVTAEEIARLPASGRASSVSGARWHEAERGGTYQRVLWNARLGLPMAIESGRRDGSLMRKVSVTVDAAAAEAPWTSLRGYARKDYSDFLD